MDGADSMTEQVPEEVSKYMSSLGKKGGKATGDCKRRSREQCQAAVKKRWDNEKKKDLYTK